MNVSLTIAGSDSGGGAGIQADLKTFAACGVFGTSVVTAITSQNTVGVSGVLELPADIIALQFDAVCSDFEIRTAKTGMLSSVEIIEIVAAKLQQWRIPKVVVDPVMIAKSGDALLRADAIETFIEKILPLAFLITPNLPEAEVLCGVNISDSSSLELAARKIWEMGARSKKNGEEFFVIVKGGHAQNAAQSTDVLFDGQNFREYSSARIESKNTHGTGCTFSAAITAELAKGASTFEAVENAKQYITRAIEQAPNLGKGHGPLQHFPA